MKKIIADTHLYRKALFGAWLVYSACAVLSILATTFFPGKTLSAVPRCYSVTLYGHECFMCGSTRSFIALGKGDIADGWHFNRFAVVLYAVFIINTIVLAYIFLKKIVVHKPVKN